MSLGAMVDKEYYSGTLRHLWEAIHRKQPDFWKLDPDNIQLHTSLLVQDFYTYQKKKHNDTATTVFPRYIPMQYFLFQIMKNNTNDQHFMTTEIVKQKPHNCVISNWDYFEGLKGE